jgi:hypothetical protein
MGQVLYLGDGLPWGNLFGFAQGPKELCVSEDSLILTLRIQ